MSWSSRCLVVALSSTALLGGCKAWFRKPTASPAAAAAVSAPAVPLVPTAPEQALLDQAELHLQSGSHEQALAEFNQLLAENPYLPDAWVGVGDVMAAQGRYREAEPAYTRATELDPGDFNAQVGRGQSLLALGRTVDGIRAMHRALTINGEAAEVHISMASAYLVLGQPEAAVGYGERAVALMPENAAARINLGAAYERTGKPGAAASQYEVAMELMPPTPQLYINLVNVYAADGRHAEALNAARELCRVSPSPNSFERLGWAQFRAGDYAASLAAYRSAVEMDAQYWPAWNGIGVNAMNTWLQSAKRDSFAANEARDAFRRSLQVNPNQPKLVRLMMTHSL